MTTVPSQLDLSNRILPLTKQVVHIHAGGEHLVSEGEAQMTQQQTDAYQGLVGGGQAKITVTKELSEKDFGNGGSCMVSVTLTCDQSYATIHQAVQLADQVATYWVDQHHNQMRQLVSSKGMLK
jgi:hypothetical protein